MNALIAQAYAALRPLPAALTRGFPQAVVPLPSITLEQKEDRFDSAGERLQALQLTLRAQSPEAADELSALVQAALAPLQLRRAVCRDAAEPGSGAYLKHMLYELRQPANLTGQLSIGGITHQALLLRWQRGWQIAEQRGLYGGAPRPQSLGLERGQLLLLLPAAALGGVMAGGPATLSLPGLPPLGLVLRGYNLKDNRLELSCDETG